MTHRLSNRCSEKGVRWNQIHSSSSSFQPRKDSQVSAKHFFSFHFCSNFQMRASCKTWTHQSTTDADLQRTYSQVFLVRKHRWRHDAQISLPLQCLRVVAHSFLLALCGLKTHRLWTIQFHVKRERCWFFFGEKTAFNFYRGLCLTKRWCMNFEDVMLTVLFAMKAHDLRDIWYAVLMCVACTRSNKVALLPWNMNKIFFAVIKFFCWGIAQCTLACWKEKEVLSKEFPHILQPLLTSLT